MDKRKPDARRQERFRERMHRKGYRERKFWINDGEYRVLKNTLTALRKPDHEIRIPDVLETGMKAREASKPPSRRRTVDVMWAVGMLIVGFVLGGGLLWLAIWILK